MLAGLVVRSTRVTEGKKAIAEADRAAKEADPYRLVLLDSNLPDMDSFEVARNIREIMPPEDAAIIVISSAGLRGDAIRCRELGIAAYLAKPFDEPQLQQIVTAAVESCSRVDSSELITRHTLRENRRRLRVLLAEDDYVNREHVTMLLEQWGHEAVYVETGAEAVEKQATESFDLVLMDMEMPKMDGLEATAAIRHAEHGSDRHIPVIAMTANAMTADREECLAAGMDGYVSKPMSGKALLQAIDEVMELVGGRVDSGVRLLEDVQGSSDHSEDADWDVNQALKYVDGDLEALTRLAKAFVEDSTKTMADIHLAIEARKAKTLHRLGHKLKGALGLLNWQPGRVLAEGIETAARNEDWPEAIDKAAKLEDHLVTLRTHLSKLTTEKHTCEYS